MADGMWVRLADVKVPRRMWWWATLVLLVRRSDRKSIAVAERVGRDLAESVVKRWEQTDAATDAMLTLTRTMVRLTWAVVVLSVIVLSATIWLGLR